MSGKHRKIYPIIKRKLPVKAISEEERIRLLANLIINRIIEDHSEVVLNNMSSKGSI